MKTFIKYIPVYLLLIISCDKEIFRKNVVAGVHDDSFVFVKFTPSFKLNLILDSITKYYNGTDSIDINLDGNFDIVVSQRIETEESISRIGTQDYFPYCWLKFKNGFEVATKTETWVVPHGQIKSVSWIDTINYEGRIDDISGWFSDRYRHMWVVPPGSHEGSYGCWYNLTNEEKYIGIRMETDSKYKFGWIKVNQSSRDNIEFISYAIEK